ncbi:Aste57867_23856 [Aphanomyces stellatus]|uniref:Aste57867_23856 protein n=1 Tax=Aphanomyces stellatus TaxID=120398 RepID=A0A485LPL2_9STRA|nr:hypothetical protein As57867_023783 [Aphanomyces stellatus]VFU00499.1 Aste57867_23856 [Aphanomyces stellatus]
MKVLSFFLPIVALVAISHEATAAPSSNEGIAATARSLYGRDGASEEDRRRLASGTSEESEYRRLQHAPEEYVRALDYGNLNPIKTKNIHIDADRRALRQARRGKEEEYRRALQETPDRFAQRELEYGDLNPIKTNDNQVDEAQHPRALQWALEQRRALDESIDEEDATKRALTAASIVVHKDMQLLTATLRALRGVGSAAP